MKLNPWIKRKKQNKKGFTLVEVVVVLVIIAILVAVAVPSVMKYIDDANEVKDDVKVSYLNKATEGYRVHLYADGKLGEDIFALYNSEKAMQQVLIDAEWIDEFQTALGDDTYYFHWNRETQKWEKKGVQTPANPDDFTILADKPNGNDRGTWQKGNVYQYNDIVTLDNGKVFKCIVTRGSSINSSTSPDSTDYANRQSVWKEIKLEFDRDNAYETGDIIKYEGSYYKAQGFDSSASATAFYDATWRYSSAKAIIESQYFAKVVWDEDKKQFVNAN